MGLTSRAWSSGGDPSCEFDSSNGGHWFFTEIVSASAEAAGGAFTGCFSGVANSCYEGIAVSQGSSPFGPYNAYYLNANYNPKEPGAPSMLNDFAKIGVTRDAFLVFYDEFPLLGGGCGDGGFNGAQEFAFDKTALEKGRRVMLADGGSEPQVQRRDREHGPAPDPGRDQLASSGCGSCSGVNFGVQVFTGQPYYGPENLLGVGNLSPQKTGPIPLGDECGPAGLSTGSPPPTSCPEGGINPNADNMTQVSQGQGQLWSALPTEVNQTFNSGNEIHNGAAYWVVGTGSFVKTGLFTITNQGYVSAAHEDMEFPAMAAEGTGGNGNALMDFTLNGNGGPTGADHGGFYPSTAYGRLTATSPGLTGSVINIADLGQSPEDGFGEYQGFPGPTRPRWGDYSWAIYPGSGDRIYFATNYIQYPNCTGSAFTLTIGTCGGTRDGFANWGSSVNYVVP